MTVQGIKWYIKLLRENYFVVIGLELANLLLIFNVECSVNLCARVHNFLSHIILIMTEKVQLSKDLRYSLYLELLLNRSISIY